MWTTRQGSPHGLASEECLRLLATPGQGLLDLSRHPLAEPVRIGFRLVGDALLLHPAPVGALLDALVAADVTLEVDATADDALSGWHVVVTGRVRSLADGELLLQVTHVSGFLLSPSPAA